MSKIFIKNSKNQNISVIIEKTKNPRWLVFVIHGLGDSKESIHISQYAESFKNNNYNIVRFDTTNTFGESDGKFEDATLTNYYEDLKDVISWSWSQDFFQEPFILCGHSLWSISAIFYAENYPEKVKALVAVSTPVNANLSKETYTKEELYNWEKTNWLIEDWGGFEVRLKWNYMKDKEKYDLLKKVDKLVMPVLIISGEIDNTTPLKHQKILFDKIPDIKEIYVIKDASHTFREQKHLKEIDWIINKWIDKIDFLL